MMDLSDLMKFLVKMGIHLLFVPHILTNIEPTQLLNVTCIDCEIDDVLHYPSCRGGARCKKVVGQPRICIVKSEFTGS